MLYLARGAVKKKPVILGFGDHVSTLSATYQAAFDLKTFRAMKSLAATAGLPDKMPGQTKV